MVKTTVKCAACLSETVLPEGRTFGFCTSCGSRIEAPAPANVQPQAPAGGYPQAPVSAYPQAPADEPPKTPRKSGLTKIIAACAAVLAVAAASVIGFTALGVSPYVKAEAKFLSTLLEAPSQAAKMNTVDFFIGYEPSTFIEQNAYISNMSLGGKITSEDNLAVGELVLKADNVPTSTIILAADNSTAVMSVPELTNYYLQWLVGDYAGGDYDFSELDSKKLEETLKNIAKSYFEYTSEAADEEKNVKLRAGGVSVTCNKYEIDFTEDLLADITLAAIDEVRANDNLMDFIDALVQSEYSYYSNADELLDEIEDEIAGTAGRNVLFTMTVWVKGGEVIGRRIDNIGGSNVSFEYMLAVDGKKAGLSAELAVNGESMTLAGDFANSGGAWDGIVSLQMPMGYESLQITADCRGLKKSGSATAGIITVTGEYDDGYDPVSVTADITLSEKSGGQSIVVGGSMKAYDESIDFGELLITFSRSNSTNPQFPALPEQYAVIVGDFTEENGERAQAMADELYDHYYSGRYEGSDIIDELIYQFWSAVDDIVWQTGYGY